MDVDEHNGHAEASGADTEAAACSEQIASSSGGSVIMNNASTSAAVVNDMQQSNSEANLETIVIPNIVERSDQQQVRQDTLQSPTANSSSISINNTEEEEHQNEQHIENAGIDPVYPLVLVSRVSVPSADSLEAQETSENNNEIAVAMEYDVETEAGTADAARIEDEIVVDRRSPGEVVSMLDSFSREGSENDAEDEDDGDEDIEAWTEEDDDEAVFLENPNLRGFANQFEAIRNMIAHTRRSMSEAEANFGLVPRNSLMQRFRRILFILNNRRRRLIRLGLAAPDVELPDAAANEDALENDEAQITESSPHENDDNMILEQEEEINENAVRFDTNLPVQHLYMGTNMNRVSGVNYLEVDQYVKLRLFIHQHVLFPGEILPFMVDKYSTIIDGDIDSQNGVLFGVCFPCLSTNKPVSNGELNGLDPDDNDQLLYGVTCQIYELGEDNRRYTLIKSRALQRFVTKASDLTVPLEYINSHPHKKSYGFVKILPDIYLPDPLNCINMGSMNRFRDDVSMKNMYKRIQAASTPFPAHVYETHNIANIIEKARTQLAQHKIDTMPTDPTQLSYWLVRNLHVPDDMLKSVFLANTVNTRLKLLASTFKKEAIFSCRNCAIHIADCRELFAMSKHGVQSQYCNSAGFIHETNTLYQVNKHNILYSGSPSTEYSWFPGYQWHIIVCKICKHHLGWEFKAVEQNLIPKKFFGISSRSVRVRLAQDRNDVPVQNAVYINFMRLMNSGMNEFRQAHNNMPNI